MSDCAVRKRIIIADETAALVKSPDVGLSSVRLATDSSLNGRAGRRVGSGCAFRIVSQKSNNKMKIKTTKNKGKRSI